MSDVEKVQAAIQQWLNDNGGNHWLVNSELSDLAAYVVKALTPPSSAAALEEQTVVWMGINDMRLMVDPSVPQDMILFPDEATRKWFENRCERLIDALKCIRKHISKMQDNNPGYDFNSDPLSTTLIEGWINTALDTEEFCPDWMCQYECPARESLKEHLESATPAAEAVTAADFLRAGGMIWPDGETLRVVEKAGEKYQSGLRITKPTPPTPEKDDE